MLTKMEEQVLITVWKFQGEAYGVNIFQHLESINKKRITVGVVYDILERLLKSGLVKTRLGSATPIRGGMKKRFYQITEEGIDKLIESKEVYDRVTNGFNDLLKQYKKTSTE